MGDREPSTPSGRARERNGALEQQRTAMEYFYWVGETFSNREKAQSLLQPEVDNNRITQYDMEKAVKYLPTMKAGKRRNVIYSAVIGSMLGLVVLRRSPRRIGFTMFTSTASACTYYVYNEIRRIRGYADFLRSLEDQTGFNRALRTMRSVNYPPSDIGRVRAVENDQASWQDGLDPARSTEVTPAPDSRVTLKRPSTETPTTKPASRWEQIRAANARSTAQNSPWDQIRQSHERPHIPESSNESPD